ncbi:MAG: lipoyl(octanoyl) transferase [Planctomycetes bacterium]|nr:lipoyl(octanoyl) transferase [Planctomycetota bacterium]NOG52813.1 lipoyl(octanoyl) transferase LipB [Planctomycetota bacterium]
MAEPTRHFEARDLGRIPYTQAYALQVQARDRLLAARQSGAEPLPMTAFVLEHDPPVITVTKRDSARQNVLMPPERLAELGIELCETDRGGDVTYHGPGQIVLYAILDLQALGIGVRQYMHLLEETVIRTIATWGIKGQRDPDGATGVWVGSADHPSSLAKICAMGVRVSKWVTMHGLALNVTTNLNHFQAIVPCGLIGRPVTSLQHLLGPENTPGIDHVKSVLVQQLDAALRR